MEKAIFRNKSINIFKETDSKRNSDLMANILKEQIRTNELLREKQWNHWEYIPEDINSRKKMFQI